MQAKKLKIASIIVTYNRVKEAKAQMDIIRELWQPRFESIDIYHEFNGRRNWYREKYKEDFLHYHKKMAHFFGAGYMLNQGIHHVLTSSKKYDYIIVTSADTWFYDPIKLKRMILTCHKKKIQLTTSLWMGIVLGTEFFIITPELAKKVFPIKFIHTINKYQFINWVRPGKIALFETLFTLRVMRVLKNPNKIYLIPGRRTVWPRNRYWSANFYASHHDRAQRKKDILPQIHNVLGSRIEKMPSLIRFLA
ncbi:hypothetical protein HY383_04640 [Candidatus Daviesbacteria bacterium]|nr:hypothetical protein [Candidatus Daviesbacteria bacterium]